MKTLKLILLSFLTCYISLFANDVAKEIVITGNDAMQFDLKKFDVSPGESVKLTLKILDPFPKLLWAIIWLF